MPTNNTTCMNVQNLADFLGVSTATVNRLLRDGRLPHHRIRGRVLFTPGDVDQLLNQTEWKPRRTGTR